MRQTMKSIMASVSNGQKPHIVAPNTIEYICQDGARVIRLHNTDILTFKKSGAIILDSGGWRTVTTKDRLNRFLPKHCVWSDKGIWYVHGLNKCNVKGWPIPFADGMIIGPRGRIYKSGNVKQQVALKKKIAAYCKHITGLDKMPMPGAGDCWICQAEKIKPGEKISSVHHLLSHISKGEMYFHGSIIVNAMRWAGYRDVSISMAVNNSFPRDLLVRTIRRYLNRQLGLA